MHFEALEQTFRLRLVSGPVDKKFFLFSRNSLSRTVGQPAARPDANLESLWKSEQDTTPEPYIFLKLDDKAVPTRGRSWVVRDACSSNRRCSTFFFKIVWAFYGSDLTGFYQSFIKVILMWISGRHNWKISKTQRMRPALRRSFDSSAPELSSEYRVGGWYPAMVAQV